MANQLRNPSRAGVFFLANQLAKSAAAAPSVRFVSGNRNGVVSGWVRVEKPLGVVAGSAGDVEAMWGVGRTKSAATALSVRFASGN